MTKKENITDEDLIKLFKLDKDDIECIEKYQKNGEGRLSESQIKYFKEWRLGGSKSKRISEPESEIELEPLPKSSPKPSPKPKKTIKSKKKCKNNKDHRCHPPPNKEGKCSDGMEVNEKNGCCYKIKKTKKTKKTKKKKGGIKRIKYKNSRCRTKRK